MSKTVKLALVALVIGLVGAAGVQFWPSDRVIKLNGFTVTLKAKSCSNDTVKQLADMVGVPKAELKQGSVSGPDGKSVGLCYLEANGKIFVIDEEGGMGFLPTGKPSQ